MPTDKEVKELIKLIEAFIENCLKIREKKSEASLKKLYGKYNSTDIKASFGMTKTFANVPWIAFLGHKQEVTKGIYPLILFIIKENNCNFEICYGVSEKKIPDRIWTEGKIKNKLPSNSLKFPSSYVDKAFTVNGLKDFNFHKEEIIDTINKVIEEFHITLEDN